MKNRICLVLPYAGKFHNYFELFLHSIYRNKDILDLLILIPDSSTPELKTEITFKTPENVFIKEVSFIEASRIFEDKLSDLFDTKIELLNNDNFSIVKKPYNLCHYRGLYNLWLKDFLKDYSHWGWTDCDLILGDVVSFYPDIFLTDCLTNRGHLAIFKNENLEREAFLGEEQWTKDLFQKAYNFFVNQTNLRFVGDETWSIRTITRFYERQKNKITPKNLNEKSLTPMWLELNGKRDYSVFMSGNGLNSLVPKDEIISKVEYKNGQLTALTFNSKFPIIYAHFMNRTKLCNNTIKINKYEDFINFLVLPPLAFIEQPA